MTPVPKPVVVRDPDYRKWIQQHECAVNHIHDYARYGDAFLSDPAHVRTKRNHGDLLIVPLCRGAHQEQHRIGVRSFAKLYRLNLEERATQLRADYLAEHG